MITGPRANYAHAPNTTSVAYKTACGDQPPCVALIVDDPTYDAGQNEAIVARLAEPTRVSGDDNQVVGIQIVYGDVSKAVDDAEERGKPLLVYSWVPRAMIMEPGRFVRITLESFYHCGPGESSLALSLHQRGVSACDYPIQHVEKAVVWRLQDPSSTNAALFVNAFNLNAEQLLELLEMVDDLNLPRNSTPSAAQLDEAACRWLNNNTDTWEAWLPDFELYDNVLYQWDVWLVVCGVVSFFGGLIIYGVVLWSKDKGKTADKEARDKMEKVDDEATEGNTDSLKTFYSSWPNEETSNRWIVSFLSCSCHVINSKEWYPVIVYLSNAIRCMRNSKHSKYRTSVTSDEKNHWSFRCRLYLFALGQLFAATSTGFLEGLVFNSWLNGLNTLSLEVTISCAVLMLTLTLAKWGLEHLPSGKEIVQRQLQIRLWIKYTKELKPIIKDPGFRSGRTSGGRTSDPDIAMHCAKQFEEAITLTASELASECYSIAFSVFSDFFGFLFAVAFLFYYTFNEGAPQDLPFLMIVAFICAPVWLVIVLLIGPLVKQLEKEGKLCATKSKDVSTTNYKTGYSGMMWTGVYALWALGPILINPLKNDYTPGTNFIPLTDLLTASKRHAVYIRCCAFAISQHH